MTAPTPIVPWPPHRAQGAAPTCAARRDFLLAGASLVVIGGLAPAGADGATLQALRADHPRVRIGRLSALQTGVPLTFHYPDASVGNILVKLGAPAGGGIGPAQDVVAFNQRCTHLGGALDGTYQARHQVLGPCPLHLTTFDLTRHGMVVSGHATESLPQIVLELQGDEIHAVGVQGLVHGHAAGPGGRKS